MLTLLYDSCLSCAWKWFPGLATLSPSKGSSWVWLACSPLGPPSWRSDDICFLLVFRHSSQFWWWIRDYRVALQWHQPVPSGSSSIPRKSSMIFGPSNIWKGSLEAAVLQVEAGNKQHWSKSKKWEIIASGWKLLTHNKLKWVQPGVSKCDAYAKTATEVNK